MIPQNNHTKHRPILLTLSIPIINNVYYGALTIHDFLPLSIGGLSRFRSIKISYMVIKEPSGILRMLEIPREMVDDPYRALKGDKFLTSLMVVISCFPGLDG
jgi:hypothetical protein